MTKEFFDLSNPKTDAMYYYINGMQELINEKIKQCTAEYKTKDPLSLRLFQEYLEGSMMVINGMKKLLDGLE